MRPLAALTGGTGFLGRHVAAGFAARGWRLRLLVRPGARAAALSGAGDAEAVEGRLADRGALAALVDGADAVVHLAGAIRARSRAGFMAINRDGTAAAAEAWRARAPGARFVLVSSLAAREPGVSAYAESKAAGEAQLGSGDAVVLRPCAVYGPGDRATLAVFRLALWPVQPVPNGPEARIALVHAADVAAAVIAAAERRMPPGTYELSDARAEGYSWPEIVTEACAACGRDARPVRLPRPALYLAGFLGDLLAFGGAMPVLTSGKRREMLHRDWSSRREAQPGAEAWRPARDLGAGFVDTVAWYRAAGWLPRSQITGAGQEPEV